MADKNFLIRNGKATWKMKSKNFLMGRQRGRYKLSYGKATWKITTFLWEGNMEDINFLMERQRGRSI